MIIGVYFDQATANMFYFSEINETCIFRKIIYECRSLINVCASVTMHTKLLTGPVTHFRKVSGIYFNENEGDLFLVSYNKDQYDLASENYLEILFKDNVEEKNCRKHKLKSTKLSKKLQLRSSSRNVNGNDGLKVKNTKKRKERKNSGDDDLKVKKTKKRKKSEDHVMSTKLSECK